MPAPYGTNVKLTKLASAAVANPNIATAANKAARIMINPLKVGSTRLIPRFLPRRQPQIFAALRKGEQTCI